MVKIYTNGVHSFPLVLHFQLMFKTPQSQTKLDTYGRTQTFNTQLLKSSATNVYSQLCSYITHTFLNIKQKHVVHHYRQLPKEKV